MVSSPSSTRFVGMKSGEHLIMTELSSRNQIQERGIYSASFSTLYFEETSAERIALQGGLNP